MSFTAFWFEVYAYEPWTQRSISEGNPTINYAYLETELWVQMHKETYKLSGVQLQNGIRKCESGA